MRRSLQAFLVLLSIGATTLVVAACSGGSKSTPGTGEVMLFDVAGTVEPPSQTTALVHRLQTVVQLPASAAKVDASSDFSMTPAPHGCRVRRFDASGAPRDADGGTVTFSGYESSTTLSALTVGTTFYPTTSPIACAVGTAGRYGCSFAAGAGPAQSTGDVLLPTVPLRVIATANGSTLATLPYWTYGDGACILRITANPQDPGNGSTQLVVCEQRPTLPATQISATLAGGAGYGASSALIGSGTDFRGAPGMYVTGVASGATDVGGVDPITAGVSLSLADGAVSPANPLTVSYSCQAPGGTGCAGHVAELRIETSASPKSAFQESDLTGEIECFSPMVDGSANDYSMTVSAAQVGALLSGQSGGSIRMELVNVLPQTVVDGNHTILFGAGAGLFGLTNE